MYVLELVKNFCSAALACTVKCLYIITMASPFDVIVVFSKGEDDGNEGQDEERSVMAISLLLAARSEFFCKAFCPDWASQRTSTADPALTRPLRMGPTSPRCSRFDLQHMV